MILTDLTRTAVSAYIKTVKWPVSKAAGLVGGRGATTKVDKADAAVRSSVADITGDRTMKDDARKRGKAAEKRETATKLREAATERRTEAEAKAEKTEAAAKQKREQAAAEEKQRKQQAAEERKKREQKAKETAARRKADAEKAESKAKAAIDEDADRKRLQVVANEKEALENRSEAVTAADESSRLAGAAARAKEARKND